MKLVKPLSLGLLHKPYRHRQRNHLVVAALGFFRLGGRADRFLVENVQWPVALGAMPPEQPLDMVMPKPRGEVLLAATAYAPEGKPVAEMPVRVRVGGVDKTLRIVGDREWLYGLFPWYRITAPAPFVAMPIAYERAYGGPRHRANPVGRGYTGNRFAAFFGRNHGPMPNVEYSGEPVASNCMRYRPAGFGPVDIRWSPRKDRQGTYDQRWLSRDFPGLPNDVDWSVFSAAPEDQQIEGFFQGGEPYRLEGMHPTQAVIEGSLPELRARAFVQREGQPPEAAEEVPMAMDTVWFFPDRELGLAVYRGQVGIEDSDALDIAAVMVGYEYGARSVEHYRQVMALRLNPETAALHAFNESQLTPEKTEAERARRAAAQQRAEAADIAGRQAVLDETMADFWADSGMEPPADHVPPKAEPLPLGLIPPEAIAEGDFDLTAMVEKATALAADAKRRGEEQLQALRAKKAELDQLAARVGYAAAPPDIEAQKAAALARAAVVAHDLVGLDGAGGSNEITERLMAASDCAERAGHPVDPSQRQQITQALAQERAMKRKARQAAPTATAPTEPLAPEVAASLGRQACQWHRSGTCLAGRDLAGADLRRADFSGADLREVMLERADLTGANFSGADLRGAVFTGATLDRADFSGARLDGANFSRSRGKAVRFPGASMNRVQAMDAAWPRADLSGTVLDDWIALGIDLTDAVLDGAQVNRALLLGACAAGSRWRQVQMDKTVAFRADLDGADFSGARLHKCVLMDAGLHDSVWEGARLIGIQGGGKADWGGSRLGTVHAEMCGWNGAGFAGADLGGEFVQCDFGGADLSGANLEGGLFCRSLFMGARLQGCRARGADFFQAMCRKADFSQADLRDANLVQAELSEAVYRDARLDGVRLDRNRRAA